MPSAASRSPHLTTGHDRTASPRTVAGGAVFVVAVVQYFVAQVVVAAAWHPAYSWSRNFISDLGNTACGQFAVPHGTATYVCSPRHSLMNGSFVVTGLLTIAGAVLLWGLWPRRRMTRVALTLLVVSGVLKSMVGLVPENTNIDLHLLAAFNLPVQSVAVLLLSMAILTTQRPVAVFGIAMAVLGLAGTIFSTAAQYGGSAFDLGIGNGGMERVAGYPGNAWVLVVGVLAAGAGRLLTRSARHGSLALQG